MRNVTTGEVKEMFISWSKKKEMLESGEWESVHLKMAPIVTHTGNIVNKTSGDWRDLLKKIKEGSGGNSGLTAAQKRKHGLIDNTIKT
jgi:hypothetical protein